MFFINIFCEQLILLCKWTLDIHLVISEDPVDMQVGVGSEPQALLARGNHARHKGSVAQSILQQSKIGDPDTVLFLCMDTISFFS